jgi:hypothetical protein
MIFNEDPAPAPAVSGKAHPYQYEPAIGFFNFILTFPPDPAIVPFRPGVRSKDAIMVKPSELFGVSENPEKGNQAIV